MSKSMSVYNHPSVIAAKQRVNRTTAKAQLQAGLGQTKTAALVAGGAYGAARLSAYLGGTEGKKIMGVPLPLAIGGVCAALGASGMAGEYGDEIMTLGLGAVAGYASQKGFNAGMADHKPQAAVSGVEIGNYVPEGYEGYDQATRPIVGAPLTEEDDFHRFANAETPQAA